jgi:hypothetical protein
LAADRSLLDRHGDVYRRFGFERVPGGICEHLARLNDPEPGSVARWGECAQRQGELGAGTVEQREFGTFDLDLNAVLDAKASEGSEEMLDASYFAIAWQYNAQSGIGDPRLHFFAVGLGAVRQDDERSRNP